MIFELKEKKDKIIEDMYEKAMIDLGEFFGINWQIDKPKIIIMKDREAINSYKDRKTESWLVGWADGKNIFLLDRKNYSKESCHKYSEKEYFKLLKHELCHLFFEAASDSYDYNQFKWLSEGLAYFVAKQINLSKVSNKFTKFIGQYSDWNGKAYNESGLAVSLLVKNFGKQKLLKLIKSLSLVKSEKDFNKLFKKIYGKNPTYSFFNNLLKNHHEQK